MAYVVGEPCVNCKYGDCVEVCPVDCFYQDEKQLYINPDECIDCDACRPACPVDAIFRGDEVPGYGDASKPPGYYKEVALKFNYKGKKPVTQKAAVQHGPGWDAKKAT